MTEGQIAAIARAGNRQSFSIIDVHAHIGGSFSHHIIANDAHGMVKVMDEIGVELAIISGTAAISSDYQFGNNVVMKSVDRYKHRLAGYCCVNPNYPEEMISEIERFRTEAGTGMAGIKIHPTFHNYPVDGKNYEPVWEYALKYQLVVLSHTQGSDCNCTPSLFSEISKKYSGVNMLIGHAGSTPAGMNEAVDLAKRRDNVFLDLNFVTLKYNTVERLFNEVGDEKLVFGSDFCWMSLPYSLGSILFSKIPDASKIRILRDNALSILKSKSVA